MLSGCASPVVREDGLCQRSFELRAGTTASRTELNAEEAELLRSSQNKMPQVKAATMPTTRRVESDSFRY
jgi:hypothetical protein